MFGGGCFGVFELKIRFLFGVGKHESVRLGRLRDESQVFIKLVGRARVAVLGLGGEASRGSP